MTYDQWKTRDPNDRGYYDDHEEEEPCDHVVCIAEYHEWENRPRWWRDLWHKITGSFQLFRQPINLDDDIPF